jgi:hypothetical protein
VNSRSTWRKALRVERVRVDLGYHWKIIYIYHKVILSQINMSKISQIKQGLKVKGFIEKNGQNLDYRFGNLKKLEILNHYIKLAISES